MKLSTKLIGAASFFLPAVALAQTPNTTYIEIWLANAKNWLNQALVIIMVLMTFWFLISVFRYIAEKEAKAATEKRNAMIRALVGLFVAVSVWGIISLLGRVTGVGQGNVYNSEPTCPPGYDYDPIGKRCI